MNPAKHTVNASANGVAETQATNTTSPARDLFTVEQAAIYLHVSQSSIRSYIRQGRLKAFRVAGLRKVLIARHEVLSLLEPAHAEPTTPHTHRSPD
jgi:excisionase family DNA binding protein